MAKFSFILPLLVAVAFQVATSSPIAKTGEVITLVNAGENHTFVEDQPNLNLNDVSEVCKTGVWVSYTGQEYSFGELPGVIEVFPYVQSSCFSPAVPNIQSTRFVGLRSDYTAPSVTLYSGEYMQGESVAFEGELSQINFPLNSFISIEVDRIELFEEPNFEGQSFCYNNNPFTCALGVCWTWNFNLFEYWWDITRAQSVRAGCSEDAVGYYAPAHTGAVMRKA